MAARRVHRWIQFGDGPDVKGGSKVCDCLFPGLFAKLLPFGSLGIAAMPLYQEHHLTEISKQFQVYGDILYAEPCKIGHINETYMATYNQGGTLVRYAHQKVNQNVFRQPEA